ncbi:hypothetical protein TNCV_3014651 [Trichonephila clavipes]|nr:hypothetical protein TNCV_3014651 [Trichonephila clavipes]
MDRNIQNKHRRIYRLFFITNDDPSIEQKECAAFQSRQESISGESPTSFPEDTPMPYSGFECESTRLLAECHNHLEEFFSSTMVESSGRKQTATLLKMKMELLKAVNQKQKTKMEIWPPQSGEGVYLGGVGDVRRVSTPGRATQGVKATPVCSAKACR